MSITNVDSSLSYIRKQVCRSRHGHFVLPWLWCQRPSNTGTLDQGGWWPPCRLLVTSASITWRTPLSRQAASKFLPLATEAVVLATKSLQIPTIHPQGFFHVFEVRQTTILFSNPTTSTKLPHNSPYTFLGWVVFQADELWPYGELIQRQALMPEQRGKRTETEEEMVIKEKRFREAKAVVGRPFSTTEVKSSDQNLFFQKPKIWA